MTSESNPQDLTPLIAPAPLGTPPRAGRPVSGARKTLAGELRQQLYHEINEAFHSTIYSGAHNDYLAQLTQATRVRVRPFRRAQFRNLGRLAKSHTEHDLILAAILRGDREAAGRAMRDHIMTVR